MDLLVEPDLGSAFGFLEERLRGGRAPPGMLGIAGRCRVAYHGRAAATTDSGDRLVLVKRDGSLLLHGPDSVKPVNWQAPGARFDAALEAHELVLWARRARPVEVVEIRFEAVSLCWLAVMGGGPGLQVSGSESELRDLLRERPELVEPGFRPWARERLTDQGPMDLYGEDAQGRRVVVEVKRVPAALAEATQLWRYVEAERRRRGPDVRGILVAPRVSPRARQMLAEHGLEFVARSWDDAASRAAQAQAGPRQPKLTAFRDAEPEQTGRH